MQTAISLIEFRAVAGSRLLSPEPRPIAVQLARVKRRVVFKGEPIEVSFGGHEGASPVHTGAFTKRRRDLPFRAAIDPGVHFQVQHAERQRSICQYFIVEGADVELVAEFLPHLLA